MGRVSKDHIDLFFEHDIDLSSKTLYLSYGGYEENELDHKLAAKMIKGLHILQRVRPEEGINIIINCEGGSVDHGLAIYDTIRSVPAPVTGTVTGAAWSMGAWVLQACDHRRLTPNSSLMIHDGAGPKDGFTRKQDLLCRNILLERIKEKHPTFSVHKLQKLLDTDTFLTAKEAVDLGLADEIVEPI